MSIAIETVVIAFSVFVLVSYITPVRPEPVRVYQAAPAHFRPERVRAVCCLCGKILDWDIDKEESVWVPPVCFGRNLVAFENRRRIQNTEE
jgi:hypothetical protein